MTQPHWKDPVMLATRFEKLLLLPAICISSLLAASAQSAHAQTPSAGRQSVASDPFTGTTTRSATQPRWQTAWPGNDPRSGTDAVATADYGTRQGNQTNAGIRRTMYQAAQQTRPTGPVLINDGPLIPLESSLFYVEPIEPRQLRKHDIVTIIVDEKSEIIMNSKYNRQKTSKLKAELKEFMRIGEDGTLDTAAINGPTIDAQLQGNLNTTGQVTNQEGIKYRIAATVTDVLPNGVLRLEARKMISTQEDVSEYTLTGELRAEDIAPDNTASSENIANLQIEKRQSGKLHDSTKRNWGYRLYDLLFPF